MKISIITVSYNSASTICETIDSVLNQTYPNIEYIVVDGNSTDETVSIIKEYEPKFQGRMHWISEPDEGLYDAMNKGIKMVTGNYIAILNSDDCYVDENAITELVDCIKKDYPDSIYANVISVAFNNAKRIDRFARQPIDGNKVLYGNRVSKHDYIHEMIHKGWHPNHPTFVVKRSIYENYGVFDTTFDIVADFELMFRFLVKEKISISFLDKYILKMRDGGKSTSSVSTLFKNISDSVKIIRSYGYHVNKYAYMFYRILYKSRQYSFSGFLHTYLNKKIK
jgi:glycosyltransferase involved in cell wall biosynthesis